MASITLKTDVVVTIDVPDELAPRMTKQDVCDTAAHILRVAGSGSEVLIGGANYGECNWKVEPNFGDIPANEADVVSADDDFAAVEE